MGTSWNRSKNKTHRQILLNELKWQNVDQIVSTTILNMTKKGIMKKSSKGINSLFNIIQPKNPRKITTQRINHKGKLNRNKMTFSANAMSKYNSLPPELKSNDITVKQFKNKIKEHITTTNLLKQH